MRVIDELISKLQDELLAKHNNWEFDGLSVDNVHRKGKDKLVIELAPDAEITIRFKVNGRKARCPTCGKTRPGWPYWWRNAADGKGLLYSCRDCVVDRGRQQSDSKASGPQGIPGD